MDRFQIRTDLALEARERLGKDACKLKGVRVEEYEEPKEELKVTRVYVESKNAAGKLGKPMGTYITIEAPTMSEPEEGYHREISKCLTMELVGLLPKTKGNLSAFVVGLGNRMVTADSLGPLVVDNLAINRHIYKEFGLRGLKEKSKGIVSSMEPGVMAKTGMETAEIIKGVVEQTNPDVIIAVDALAAGSVRRLNRTIQITDTGIWPGSGVGNHRNALNPETMGVPVIAIGVPTVVDAATIVGDSIEKMMDGDESFEICRYMNRHREILPELHNMFMTGKDVDALVKRISFTLSEGINMALSGAY